MSDALDIAVRAWAHPTNPDDRRAPATNKLPVVGPRFPEHALVFDTETTTDATQALNFGSWRYCRATTVGNQVVMDCVAEGLFYADDLPERDPNAHRALLDYAERRHADVRPIWIDANPRLTVEPLSGWVERILWRAAYELRAAIVCFNSPFDLSRIAWKAGPTRTFRPDERVDAFEGGFSFAVFGRDKAGERVESLYRPRVAIKSIDSKRSLKGFRPPRRADADNQHTDKSGRRRNFTGHFLDLRTLVFALTDRGHTLESACKAFGVDYIKRDVEHGSITEQYITYCRDDTAATERLAEAALASFLQHPIALQATRAYSPATIGKAYLKHMGITPPTTRSTVTESELGWAMSAYDGGRSEVRIRRTPVPVVYCDFKSMYPTVCALMDVWALLTCETITSIDATAEVQQLLETIDADACFQPTTWTGFIGIAQVVPDGDVLPVRARYGAGPSWQIGVNPLTSTEALWSTIPDLIASKVLTGRTPRILRALRFVGTGTAPDLHPVSLLGTTKVDPRARDFFVSVIEQRTLAERRGDENASEGLKTLANATSYGIYAQMTRRELGGGRRENVTVFGRRDDPFHRRVASPEQPGEYTFSPVAAAITGAARLLLALVEHQVTQTGGSYAFCDTDSMAIVATQHGGLVACQGGPHLLSDGQQAVRALSWEQVETIRERFTSLNPYDPEIVPGSILELEDENYTDKARTQRRQLYCYAISAKRYTFYTPTPDGPRLVKPSQHGLGHLLNPTDPHSDNRDWITDVWHWVLADALNLPARKLQWLERPAVGQLSISSPGLHRLLRKLNHGHDYAEQIKPFNFLLIAFVHPLERPADDQRMVLIAPYATNPTTWTQLPWTNRHSTHPYTITTDSSNSHERPGLVTVKTYHNLLTEYATHPESKSADPSGTTCTRQTRGLLARRPIHVRTITHIGKEANSLDDAQAGLIDQQDAVLNEYDDTERLTFGAETLPRLRELGVREVARRTGHSLGAVHAVLAGRSQPRPVARLKYGEAAARLTPD